MVGCIYCRYMGGASHRLVKHLSVVREPEAAVAGPHVVALVPHDVAAEPQSTVQYVSFLTKDDFRRLQ